MSRSLAPQSIIASCSRAPRSTSIHPRRYRSSMENRKYIPPSKREGYIPPPVADSGPPPPTVYHGREEGNEYYNRYRPRRGGYQNQPARPSWSDSPAHLRPLRTIVRDDLIRHFGHPHDGTLTFYGFIGREGRSVASLTRFEPEYFTKPRSVPLDPTIDAAIQIPLPPSPPPRPPAHPLEDYLSYVLIFYNAQPKWKSHREVWLHTHADRMIADWTGLKRNYGRPIPVFEATDRRVFEFAGWWIVDRAEVVEPRSDALIEILETKQDSNSYVRGRTAESWARSLDSTWIKLFFIEPTASQRLHLKSPLDLKGGIEGNEVEKYVLEVAGLKDELEILEGCKEDRKRGIEVFIKGKAQVRH